MTTTQTVTTVPATGAAATQGEINANFLGTLKEHVQSRILGSIAGHYGITQDEAYAEVTGAEAHHLLEYLEEPRRSSTAALMRQHGSF